MGIPDFLPRVLDSAGRPLDLRDFAQGRILIQGHKNKRRRRRPLRIGIDITSWVYKAAHGFGDMLGDGRHLTNYGRAALVDEQEREMSTTKSNDENVQKYITTCNDYVMKRLGTLKDKSKADLIVVLDGKTPPTKAKEVERRRKVREENVRQRDEPVDPNQTDVEAANEMRTKAFRRAGAGKHFSRIIDELIRSLRESQVPFLVAPYEADSQLAYMSKKEYIDLVITEDSDLVAYGAKAILYKSVNEIGNGFPRGILFQYESIGSVTGTLNLSDFSPIMMAVLFVAVGCDYCEKLKGIGLITACRVVRKAFLESSSKSVLPEVFSQLYTYCFEKTMSDQYKRQYEERFLAALYMYLHPIVYDPVLGRCIVQGEKGGGRGDDGLWGEAALLKHGPYAALCKNPNRKSQIIGELGDPKDATAAAEAFGRGLVSKSESDQCLPDENAVQENSDGTSSVEDGGTSLLPYNTQETAVNEFETSNDQQEAAEEEEESPIFYTQQETLEGGNIFQDKVDAEIGDDFDQPDENFPMNSTERSPSPNLLYSSTP